MKRSKFDIPIYGTECILIWNCTEEEMCDYLNNKYKFKWKMEPIGLSACRIELEENDYKFYAIWISKYCKNLMQALVHELFHLIDSIMQYAGMTLSRDSREAYAYLIGFVTEKAMLKMKLKVTEGK